MNILHFSLHAFPGTISLLPHQWSWVPSFFLSYAATWYSNDILYFMTSLLLCHENLSPQKRSHIADSLPRISISQLFNKEQKKVAVNYSPASQKTAHFIPVIWTSGLVHCSKRRRYILLILVVIPSRMYTVSKLNKQNEQAWVNLQRLLNYVQFPYSKLFTNDEVHRFVKIRLYRLEALKAIIFQLCWLQQPLSSYATTPGLRLPHTISLLTCSPYLLDIQGLVSIKYVELVLRSFYQHFPIFFLRLVTSYIVYILFG